MILYIHGAFSTPAMFNYINLKVGGKASFLEYDVFEPLSDTLDRLYKETANNEYRAIIGHSLGGIIGYRLLQKGVRAQKLITMSSPFGGATPVSWVVHMARKSKGLFPLFPMKPEVVRFIDFVDNIDKFSPEFKELRLNPVPQAEYYSIVTNTGKNFMPKDNDYVVTVESQMSNPASPEYYNMHCAHGEVVLREETVTKIKEWLRK